MSQKKFRLKRGIPAGYARQGYIYFSSLAYRQLDERKKQKIVDLCKKAGGENWEALMEFVTTDESATSICMRHYIASKTTLYRAVRAYYLGFPRSF